MKITFPLPHDDAVHRICMVCGTDNLRAVTHNGRRGYRCDHCNKTYDRSIFINPTMHFWLDEQGELWHESAHVFVRNADGKFLFYERTEYPFGLTVPAGHVDVGMTPSEAAVTELQEEVGVTGVPLRELMVIDTPVDACSAGADAHKVHIFMGRVEHLDITMDTHEGHKPEWLTLDEAVQRPHLPLIDEAIRYCGDSLKA